MDLLARNKRPVERPSCAWNDSRRASCSSSSSGSRRDRVWYGGGRVSGAGGLLLGPGHRMALQPNRGIGLGIRREGLGRAGFCGGSADRRRLLPCGQRHVLRGKKRTEKKLLIQGNAILEGGLRQ